MLMVVFQLRNLLRLSQLHKTMPENLNGSSPTSFWKPGNNTRLGMEHQKRVCEKQDVLAVRSPVVNYIQVYYLYGNKFTPILRSKETSSNIDTNGFKQKYTQLLTSVLTQFFILACSFKITLKLISHWMKFLHGQSETSISKFKLIPMR